MSKFDPSLMSEFRERNNLTQVAAAKMAGIHSPDWSKFERGKATPSENTRKKIEDLFALEKEEIIKAIKTYHSKNEEVVVEEGDEKNLGAFNGINVMLVGSEGPKKFIEMQQFKDGGYLAIDDDRNYYTVYPLD